MLHCVLQILLVAVRIPRFFGLVVNFLLAHLEHVRVGLVVALDQLARRNLVQGLLGDARGDDRTIALLDRFAVCVRCIYLMDILAATVVT